MQVPRALGAGGTQPHYNGAGAGNKQEVMSLEAFLARITEEVRTRALAP